MPKNVDKFFERSNRRKIKLKEANIVTAIIKGSSRIDKKLPTLSPKLLFFAKPESKKNAKSGQRVLEGRPSFFGRIPRALK